MFLPVTSNVVARLQKLAVHDGPKIAFRAAVKQVGLQEGQKCVIICKELPGSIKKMQPFDRYIRGLTINEAIVQTNLHSKKVANMVSLILQDAKRHAVQDLNMKEDNLIVFTSWVEKAKAKHTRKIKAKGFEHLIMHRRTDFAVTLKEANPEQLRIIETYQNIRKGQRATDFHLQQWHARVQKERFKTPEGPDPTPDLPQAAQSVNWAEVEAAFVKSLDFSSYVVYVKADPTTRHEMLRRYASRADSAEVSA